MTSPESSHPLLKNFLKTWNSISVETQTEESDLPSTLKIELELGTLKKKLEYQSDFLQVRNTSILHDRLEELKNEMMRQCLKLENENQSTLTRMRIAAKLEAMNEAKMIEAKWKANYEKKLSEISQENQILNEELTRLKKSFRVSQIQASEEIVQLKAALANSFSWITKNYGELASKEVQENSEEEQTIILHLHRQLQEKNEQISVLQHQLDDQMSSESSSPDSTSSVQSTQNSCGSLNISSNFGKAEESLKKEELVRIQEEEKEWNEKEEETSVLSGSISSYSTSHQSSNQHERSLGQSISSGHNKDSHSPQPSIFEIPFKKVKQPSMEEALHKLQKAMELRLEKTKFFYENEISNLKKTIDSYKTQQESFKECLNSFLDPSKVAIILGRQKALLELAANAIKSTPSTPLGGMQQNPPELDPLSKVTPVLSLPFHSTEKFSGNSKARKKSILKETSTTPSKGTATKKSTQSTKKAH